MPSLHYSQSVKDLLQGMLSESEQDRPKMEAVMQYAATQAIQKAICPEQQETMRELWMS